MTNSQNILESKLEEVILNTITKALSSNNFKEWMTLAEGAKYAGVSPNTLMKFREMGLKICQVDGVKRVSRKEIDHFLEKNSY